MRIAVLSAFPVFPTDEGNRSRILNVARALRADGHEVHFVYMPSRTPGITFDPPAHAAEFGAERFHVLSRPALPEIAYAVRRAAWKARRTALRRAGSKDAWYFGLDELWTDGFTGQLRDLHARLSFDAAMVEYVFHSKALEAFPQGVVRVLDTHDSFADRHAAFVFGGERRDYWYSIPPGEQERGFARADHVLAIQDEEAETFARAARGRYRVWRLGHMPEPGEPLSDFSPVAGLFLGSGNEANTTSVRTFVADVLPRVTEAVPAFRLVLAGGICARVEDHPSIDKIGAFDRPVDAFARAPLLVNYMRMGTGIGIKLLDALAAGVPVVSTRTGARGLPEACRGGMICVEDDDAAGFADGLVRLLRDRAAREEMGASSRQAARTWNEAQREVLRAVFGRAGAV